MATNTVNYMNFMSNNSFNINYREKYCWMANFFVMFVFIVLFENLFKDINTNYVIILIHKQCF